MKCVHGALPKVELMSDGSTVPKWGSANTEILQSGHVDFTVGVSPPEAKCDRIV